MTVLSARDVRYLARSPVSKSVYTRSSSPSAPDISHLLLVSALQFRHFPFFSPFSSLFPSRTTGFCRRERLFPDRERESIPFDQVSLHLDG